MGLRVADRFLWDFWTIDRDGETYLYTLSAPRDPDPETRHGRARVDLAVSRDLRAWDYHGPVLEPGPEGAWDDLTIWTGSVAARPEGGWAMLYTGRTRADDGRAQRIGLALSDDLVGWRKHHGPVIEADPIRYRVAPDGACAWRDPWLEWQNGEWHAYVTAQHPGGSHMDAGCIAHATSTDLVRWTVRPPITDERLCEHLEVPQILHDSCAERGAGASMLVNVYPHFVPEGSFLPRACMSLLYRRCTPDEPFRFARVVEAWPSDARYIVKQVRPGIGLCWLGRQTDGTFLGEIGEPFPLDLARD